MLFVFDIKQMDGCSSYVEVVLVAMYVLFDFRHSLLSQSLSFLLGSREGTLWIWTLGRCHTVLSSLFKMPFELYFSVPKLCSMLKEPTEPALKNALIEPICYPVSHYSAGRVNYWNVLFISNDKRKESPGGSRWMFWKQRLGPHSNQLLVNIWDHHRNH